MGGIAFNLKRIRSFSGMSQHEVATKAKVSIATYRNLESGRESNPRVSTLENIANALGVKTLDLLRQVKPLHAVRFRAKKKMYSREHILAEVSKKLENYERLENLLKEINQEERAYLFNNFELPTGECRAMETAKKIREYLLEQKILKDIDSPIRDICGLLESIGISVLSFTLSSDEFFGLSVRNADGGHPAIVINTWDRISVERWIFSAAHELGHLLMHNDSYDVSDSEEREKEEKEANEFASYFLMPHDLFIREITQASGHPLAIAVWKVKKQFNVSYKTVLYRLSSYDPDVWSKYELSRRYLGHKAGKIKHAEHYPASPEEYASVLKSEEADALSSYACQPDKIYYNVKRALSRDLISINEGAEILGLSSEKMRDLMKTWYFEGKGDQLQGLRSRCECSN